ncbi:helix-turn-helix domain-containing protein [Streptomyces sp. NPDC000927]|uniref:helix-turn-helix domain-containing protein n=1 Tax=Streptomyces sp. NPDC000927 TaxID=3154371 RepID=UPI00332ACF09
MSTPYATRKPRAALDWVKFDGDLAWDGSVSPNAKAVYAALGRFADLHDRNTPTEADQAPTRQFLADCIGKSKDTVDRAIKELEGHGLLHVERRRDPDNPKLNLPSVYHLLDAERWDEKAATRAEKRRVEREARSKKDTPDGYPCDDQWRHIGGGRTDAATPSNVPIDPDLGGRKDAATSGEGGRKGAARGGRKDAPTPPGGGRKGAAHSYSSLNGQFEKLEESSSKNLSRAGAWEPAGGVDAPAAREEDTAAPDKTHTTRGTASSSAAPSMEAVALVNGLSGLDAPAGVREGMAVQVDRALLNGYPVAVVRGRLGRAVWSRVRQPVEFVGSEVEKWFSGPFVREVPVVVDVSCCPECRDTNGWLEDEAGVVLERCGHERLVRCPDCRGGGRVRGGGRCGHGRSPVPLRVFV